MLEDFTYTEIEDIIREKYLDVKETLEFCVLQRQCDTRSVSLRNRIREQQCALNAIMNLMEDLTMEFDDEIILEDNYD
jgi:hypothetical protein